MIRLQQIKVPIKHSREDIIRKACKMLGQKESQIKRYEIVKQSIDARHGNVSYVYTLDLEFDDDARILSKKHLPNVSIAKKIVYSLPDFGGEELKHRPVIAGSGPAGLFAAYALAIRGYAPIVYERGNEVDVRTKDVEEFWRNGVLKPNSNVQFGEGGAGTFSDGKLNTLVKDVLGRNRFVLETFVKMGAPEEILYVNKPHIGTDLLKSVVKNLRREIITLGGSFSFQTQVTNLTIKGDHLFSLELNHRETKETDVLILAIGHSARDTFEMLKQNAITMEAKSFAVGMRVEHPQEIIDICQYKTADRTQLPAASYKLTANLDNQRGVYSFCMCPGGYVVNASSEEEALAVNGMSYHARDGKNANSAIIVSVTPKDFEGQGALAGVEFQRKLEHAAWRIGGGRIPQQLFGDFENNRISSSYGAFESATKGGTMFANLREIFPDVISETFRKGMHLFSKYIPDYDRSDVILSGVESRTSSPVRIPRDAEFESNIKGIYPCGEGAGYAGGIMSAAMDGLKTAEAVIRKYKPCGNDE